MLRDDPSRPWSLEESYRYCEDLTYRHYENFPVASIFIPKAMRKHVAAIYAFARTADDFADELPNRGKELGLLAGWQKNLELCYEGHARFPIFVALADTAKRFDLPIQLFRDLLDAFAQDVVVKRYETFPNVLDYCRRSANPVGRLVLMLFGHKDTQMFLWSDAICTALQLANFWQDVAVDWEKDRVYLPMEDCARFAYAMDGLGRAEANEAFRGLMDFQVKRTQALFDEGKPLLRATQGRLRLELKAVWLGGTRILQKIRAVNFDVFSRRPVLTWSDKIQIAAQVLFPPPSAGEGQGGG